MTLVREAYNRAFYLGTYYAWAARKGYPPAGNDPLTGYRGVRDDERRALGRVMHTAAARFYFTEARRLRVAYGT